MVTLLLDNIRSVERDRSGWFGNAVQAAAVQGNAEVQQHDGSIQRVESGIKNFISCTRHNSEPDRGIAFSGGD